MLRWVCGFLFLLGCFGFSLADDPKETDKPEPPVRLKKKMKKGDEPEKKTEPEKKAEPKAEPEKKVDDKPDERRPERRKTERVKEGKDGKGDEPAPADDEDAKEIVTRIGKNMRSSEDRLAKKDPGEGTRQIQRDILKDLDGLIEQNKRQQQQQQQESDPRDQQQDQNQQQQQTSRQQREKKQSSGKKPGQDKEKDKQNAKDNPQGGGRSPEGSKIADLYKDIWGHLPETLRQEMDAYSREQFMAKYQDLLKQYYATIAEKGNKRD